MQEATPDSALLYLTKEEKELLEPPYEGHIEAYSIEAIVQKSISEGQAVRDAALKRSRNRVLQSIVALIGDRFNPDANDNLLSALSNRKPRPEDLESPIVLAAFEVIDNYDDRNLPALRKRLHDLERMCLAIGNPLEYRTVGCRYRIVRGSTQLRRTPSTSK